MAKIGTLHVLIKATGASEVIAALRAARMSLPWTGEPEWFDDQAEAMERAQWVANHQGFIVWVMLANDGRFIVSRDAWHDEVEDWGTQVDPNEEEYERLHPPT
jgi:hypothetical protein